MRLLCLSNGHGEDTIALRILRALQQQPNPPVLEALPIVGEGYAYLNAGIRRVGSVKTMPSGGFINTDRGQLARDLQGGLLPLTLSQWRTVREWSQKNGNQPGEPACVLAVGDIVPLLFAYFSGLPYAFVGTAKSEYYIRDESGLLPRRSWWDDRLERWTGCVYHPWERWLMTQPRCKAVFPRDTITAQVLRQLQVPAYDAGNPMMDGLEPQADFQLPAPTTAQQSNPGFNAALLTIVLLPGSHPPEAYANWEIILQALNRLVDQTQRPLRFLVAVAPGLEGDRLHQIVRGYRWQPVDGDTYWLGVGERQATLTLGTQFAEYLHQADLAIAMAGTATEQFVGLGKPALTIAGPGPQFTPAFAEAQTRLLGASVTLVSEPSQVASALHLLLDNPDRLHWIAENGPRRLGTAGAAQRIAAHLLAVMREP